MNDILINPTWENIETVSKLLANLIIRYKFQPEYVIGIARGGLIPAVIISQTLNIPLIPISYSSKIGVGDQRNHDNFLPTIVGEIMSGTGMGVKKPNICIVDDIADSGNTMKEINDFYVNQGYKTRTITLYFKESSIFVPDYTYYHIPEDSPFIQFPWER